MNLLKPGLCEQNVCAHLSHLLMNGTSYRGSLPVSLQPHPTQVSSNPEEQLLGEI